MEYVILFNRFPRDEECLAQVRCQTRHELNLSFGKNADGHKIVFFWKEIRVHEQWNNISIGIFLSTLNGFWIFF